MTQMQSQIIRLSEALQRLTPDGATASSRAGEENRQYLRTLSSEQVSHYNVHAFVACMQAGNIMYANKYGTF